MQSPASAERRRSSRHPADWRVLFGPPGALIPGFIADVGPGGVCILSETEYPAGTTIEVHFWTREDPAREMLVHGEVRRCKDHRIGVQFLDLDFNHHELLWKLMQGSL